MAKNEKNSQISLVLLVEKLKDTSFCRSQKCRNIIRSSEGLNYIKNVRMDICVT